MNRSMETRKLDGKPMRLARELDEFRIGSLLPSLCRSSVEGVRTLSTAQTSIPALARPDESEIEMSRGVVFDRTEVVPSKGKKRSQSL
jgi:hypothetical protein